MHALLNPSKRPSLSSVTSRSREDSVNHGTQASTDPSKHTVEHQVVSRLLPTADAVMGRMLDDAISGHTCLVISLYNIVYRVYAEGSLSFQFHLALASAKYPVL